MSDSASEKVLVDLIVEELSDIGGVVHDVGNTDGKGDMADVSVAATDPGIQLVTMEKMVLLVLLLVLVRQMVKETRQMLVMVLLTVRSPKRMVVTMEKKNFLRTRKR